MPVIRIVVHARRSHIAKWAQLWCKWMNNRSKHLQNLICVFVVWDFYFWPLSIRKRVFILGPSHHVRLRGCALTTADKYETPLYDLQIDAQINAELEKTGKFTRMDMNTDEDEHSIEMHLPYVAKVMREWVLEPTTDLCLNDLLWIYRSMFSFFSFRNQFTVIPILVGSISPDVEATYGELLAPYLADPQNLFVISSDFCHWGKRFSYTYYDESCGPIHKSIENLDKNVCWPSADWNHSIWMLILSIDFILF